MPPRVNVESFRDADFIRNYFRTSGYDENAMSKLMMEDQVSINLFTVVRTLLEAMDENDSTSSADSAKAETDRISAQREEDRKKLIAQEQYEKEQAKNATEQAKTGVSFNTPSSKDVAEKNAESVTFQKIES